MITFNGFIEVRGKVKYENVSGSYSVVTDLTGKKSWSGSLQIRSGETPKLIEGTLYTNVGKNGKIIFESISSGIISFIGDGPIE
jgi:hypothetical protein